MSARDIVVVSVILLVTAIILIISSYLTTTVLNKAENVSAFNSSARAIQSMESIKGQLARWDYIFFAVFVGLMLGLIISGWLVQANPIFALGYILFIAFGIFVSPILSNVYYAFVTESLFVTTAATMPLMNYVMLKLPYFIAIFGILGLVLMFSKPYIVGEQI